MKIIIPFLLFLYFFSINQLFAQFSGGSYDGFYTYTTPGSSTLNGEYINYIKYQGDAYDGFALVSGLITQLDGQQSNQLKYTGGNNDGFYLLASDLIHLDGNSTMYQAYIGGSDDGFDVYTMSGSFTLNGQYINYNKYHGGAYDGFALVSGLITQLDGQQTSQLKYAGGNYDGSFLMASDLIYLDGNFVMYNAYFGGVSDGYASTISFSDISLPVTLTLFALQEIPQQTAVRIEWCTESEIENAYWLLLRRTEDDSTLATIQKITVQGNSSVISEYAYRDADVEAGNNYTYQLADVSINGQITYHEEKSISVSIPKSFELFQNHPNPFNPNTNIKFALPQPAIVRINVYNILGQKIIDLLNEQKKAGYHTVVWDGNNNHGNTVSSGMYVYLMQAEAVSNNKDKPIQKVKKMLLVR